MGLYFERRRGEGVMTTEETGIVQNFPEDIEFQNPVELKNNSQTDSEESGGF